MYQLHKGCGKKDPLRLCIFLSNRWVFKSEMLSTYLVILNKHNGIIII